MLSKLNSVSTITSILLVLFVMVLFLGRLAYCDGGGGEFPQPPTKAPGSDGSAVGDSSSIIEVITILWLLIV